MKKKKMIISLAACLAAAGISFGGCGAMEAVRDSLARTGRQWEKESREAELREEDLPGGTRTPEGTAAGETGQDSGAAETGKEDGGGSGTAGDGLSGEGDGSTEHGGTAEDAGAYSFEEDKPGQYAYDSLNAEEQLWYRNISRILGQMQSKQSLAKAGLEAGLDEKDIDKIFQCVLNDHPEYFYVEGYTYTKFTRQDKPVKIEFSGTYGMDQEEARARQQQIQAAAGEILAGIASDASDYDKIKYVYETIIRNTEYDLNSEENQNIYSVFVNRASVCQGYAKATQYLLNQLGVECTMVMGTVDTGEGHAWNLVKADGSYYYVDTTWGDASYQMEESERDASLPAMPEINYDYLCVTTEQLLRTHTLGGVVPMPQCVAMEDNYYVREGAYFTEYNEEQTAAVFAGAVARGRKDVTLKCQDMEVYGQMCGELIAGQKIFDFLDSSGDTIAYAQNEKQLSVTFWVTNE